MAVQTEEEANALELSRKTARAFADKWKLVTNEKQFAQSFWSDFFTQIVQIPDLLAAGVDFEVPVKDVTTGTTKFIDCLLRNVVLIEHKSSGLSLDKAEQQARAYLVSLPSAHRPPVLFVSDFAKLRIVDVLLGTSVEFALDDLPNHLDHLDAVFKKYGKNATLVEVEANADAVAVLAKLYQELEKAGYEGHSVSVFLVRILFLLFGEDTRMFKSKGIFTELVEDSPESGFGLGGTLQELFQNLNTEKRPANLDDRIKIFPYVNGGLFKENLPIFSFTEDMRSALLLACHFQWQFISPDIFGSMFQIVKKQTDRRALGEHYTSEASILKVIRPLFLDDYLERLRKNWDDRNGLRKLRKDLGSNRYLDPAAGSGNFLVVTYRRLREIEHKIIARLIELEGKLTATGFEEGEVSLQVGVDGTIGLTVSLHQLFAIEYEEWSSQIALVALFLTDHQLNLQLEELTGASPNRFPLQVSATIRHGNALQVDWTDVCPIDDRTVILGNPPFNGADMSKEQRADQALVWAGISGGNELDYVANWYLIAAKHMQGTKARAAFVSTSSITQGQQPPILWGQLPKYGMGIDFAHRSFKWANGAPGQAVVTCVIIGISALPKPTFRSLWSYETAESEPTLVKVRNINAYLLDAADVLITTRKKPLNPATQIVIYGSKPVDEGWISNIKPDEAARIRATDPIAAKYLRRIIGADELIHDKERYCLWMRPSTPEDRLNSPVLKERIGKVRAFREASTKQTTVDNAVRSWEFQQIRQPSSDYIVIPLHSSEFRDYIPMPFFPSTVIASNAVSFIPNGDLNTFGFLMSSVFNVWAKAVSGRIKNDPRISNTITYNNFPFPQMDSKKLKAVEKAAQEVLDARALFPTSTLATLYHRDAMPTELRKAHGNLDRAVLNAFDLKSNATDIAILELLFNEYAAITEGLLATTPVKRKRS